MSVNQQTLEDLTEELADLSHEVITALADQKISWTEVLAVVDDLVEVRDAVKAVVDPDESKKAARKARRQARRLARQARKAAKDALKE